MSSKALRSNFKKKHVEEKKTLRRKKNSCSGNKSTLGSGTGTPENRLESQKGSWAIKGV